MKETTCPNCGKPITGDMVRSSMIPCQFQCGHCHVKLREYKVSAPIMAAAIAITVVYNVSFCDDELGNEPLTDNKHRIRTYERENGGRHIPRCRKHRHDGGSGHLHKINQKHRDRNGRSHNRS